MLLDIAAVDLIGMASKEYIAQIPFLPQHIHDLAPSVAIYYIAPGKTFEVTPDGKMQATHDYAHPDVQPGKLDIVLVPGPEPEATFDEESLSFLRRHAATEGTDIISICTGAFLCAASGMAEGRTLCGPRGVQDSLRKKNPGVKFVGEKCRWHQDGNIWSSGKSFFAYSGPHKGLVGS